MDPKKINSQDAFDLVTRRQGKEMPEMNEVKDVEEGFGENREFNIEARSVWQRAVFLLILVIISCVMIAGVVAFYWFITNHAEPDLVEKEPPEAGPAAISEEQAKLMMGNNLRAFLLAESNEERLKYVYMPEDERDQLAVYYGERKLLDKPLWKVERVEVTMSAQGEVWYVVYRDLAKKQHLVSFQRYGDDYLLHWSAMTAFCDIPWEQFMVQRPTGPVTMRCYLRQYEGVWPSGISPNDYHCFLLEDRGGLFSEMAIIKNDTPGFMMLKTLPKRSRHPVTLVLGHKPLASGEAGKSLHIMGLKYLRWQKMSQGLRVEGLE